jgi:hypothetical protein
MYRAAYVILFMESGWLQRDLDAALAPFRREASASFPREKLA